MPAIVTERANEYCSYNWKCVYECIIGCMIKQNHSGDADISRIHDRLCSVCAFKNSIQSGCFIGTVYTQTRAD